MSVISPDKFPLLSRVIRKSKKQGTVDIDDSLDGHLKEVDAIVPINWYRVDDFSYPERNVEAAAEFRDWYIDEETISPDTFLISEPPIQMDVSISKSLLQRDTNLMFDWYNYVAASLMSTMNYVAAESRRTSEPMFLY